MIDLTGKVAFVTGGGTGIGRGCAEAIAAAGGTVVIAGRREAVLRETAARLGRGASWVACDVTSTDSVEAAIRTVRERHGRLDAAVNSAGTGSAGSVLNGSVDEFLRTLDVNLTGVYRCVQAEARAMKEGGGGSIVNISSIAAALTHRWMTGYCVSKAGVNMLTRCAADDLGEYGIRVNAVMPGLVPTELASVLADSDEAREEYLRLMPVRRLGTPADVGALVAFLCSDAAGWITGQCIGVDGGHTLRKGPDLVALLRQFLPE